MQLELLPQAKVWRYKDLVVLTDKPQREGRDSVFPLCPENIMAAQRLAVSDGDSVLDVGTGSGFLALVAAQRASRVLAIDVNPRAVEFARFNTALNGLERKVSVKQGSLFEGLDGIHFDTIVSNPPFEPTPDGSLSRIHSAAGPSGLDVTTRIVTDAPKYLRPGGILQLITYLPSPDGLDHAMKPHLTLVANEVLGTTNLRWLKQGANSSIRLTVYLITMSRTEAAQP